jgi:hypothetical protein
MANSVFLDHDGRMRDRALFDLAIDSKLNRPGFAGGRLV